MLLLFMTQFILHPQNFWKKSLLNSFAKMRLSNPVKLIFLDIIQYLNERRLKTFI